MRTTRYEEPSEYIPKELRKQFKIGEYAETNNTGKQSGTKSETAKKVKRATKKK